MKIRVERKLRTKGYSKDRVIAIHKCDYTVKNPKSPLFLVRLINDDQAFMEDCVEVTRTIKIIRSRHE